MCLDVSYLHFSTVKLRQKSGEDCKSCLKNIRGQLFTALGTRNWNEIPSFDLKITPSNQGKEKASSRFQGLCISYDCCVLGVITIKWLSVILQLYQIFVFKGRHSSYAAVERAGRLILHTLAVVRSARFEGCTL